MNREEKNLKTALERTKALEYMLKQIMNHANTAAMYDAKFRAFAWENAKYVLENTEVE